MFAADDDEQLLRHVLDTKATIEADYDRKEAQVRAVIDDLGNAISNLQAEIAASPEEHFVQDRDRAERDQQRLRDEISRLQKQRDIAIQRLAEVGHNDGRARRFRIG